jgi:peptidoglycan L-alanyl-D-glutamate endopeptidase CwlK
MKDILSKVSPKFAAQIRTLQSACKALGHEYRLTSGLRTYAEQDALYALGRTKPGGRVTNAKGGQSYHNFGLAVDFVAIVGGKVSWVKSDYQTLGKEAQRMGLVWGGVWKFVDIPHVQRGEYSLAVMDRAFKSGGLPAVWSAVGA